jgi:hypothetical protein
VTFSEAEWPDRAAYDIAVASIRRHSMDVDKWAWTSIAALRPELAHRLFLHAQELPLVSAFISDKSWCAFTTRRIVACHQGRIQELDPRYGIESDHGNFKGIDANRTDVGMGAIPTEVARIRSLRTAEPLTLEFETGNASMAVIYACMFWERTTRFRLA